MFDNDGILLLLSDSVDAYDDDDDDDDGNNSNAINNFEPISCNSFVFSHAVVSVDLIFRFGGAIVLLLFHYCNLFEVLAKIASQIQCQCVNKINCDL